MEIIVNTLKEKLSLLRQCDYADWLCHNKKQKVSTLSYIKESPEVIKLNTDNRLEILLNTIFDKYYNEYNHNIGIEIYENDDNRIFFKDLNHMEYNFFVKPYKERGMRLNTFYTGSLGSDEEYNELYDMIIDWLNDEIKLTQTN